MWVSKMKDNGDAMNTSFVSFRIGGYFGATAVWDNLGLKITIEIVDFPIDSMGGSFHSYVNVYQRVISILVDV